MLNLPSHPSRKPQRLKQVLSGLLIVPMLAMSQAQAREDHHDDFHHGHEVVVHRNYPAYYHHAMVPREHFYHGIRVWRPYGPRYAGFGFWYDDAAAFAFLGFTAWTLASYAALDEAQMRAHEDAIAEAASAPVNEPITWNDGDASGSVTTVREGRTNDGRACREFQQKITVAGKVEDAYGTACQQPDGSWQIQPTG